jgi:hypothetical protein
MHGLMIAWTEADISNHCKLLMVFHEGVLNKYINSDYFVNLLTPKTYFLYHQFLHSEILCLPHSAFMCFVWIPEQKNDHFSLQR